MPENLDMPRTVTDITGVDVKPSAALAEVYRLALAKEPGMVHKDIAALALVYAGHISPLFVPFDVEMLSLGALEERGYIKVTELGSSSVKVHVLR